MDNNELKSIFNKILSDNVLPYLKTLDYEKQGSNFRYYDKIENFGKIVNFQKSQYIQISFTINIGIYTPEFEYNFYKIPKMSNEKFLEPICTIRKRIGALRDGTDKWYELNEKTNINNLIKDMENDIKNRVIPFLKKFKNKEYIFEQLFMERYFGNYEVARIKTLYKNGYKDNIINITKSENYQSKYKGMVLEKINEWIKEN
jgi:hypothetical protein